MRITHVSIENFRCFGHFAIDVGGESRLLVGENAIGKSSLITGIARALGRERGFQQSDFLDLAHAIDIRVTLTGLDTNQLGTFAEAADFGSATSLTVAVMVTWDPDTEECDVRHGYPTKAWKQSSRIEREAIDVYWIADTRDPSRLLQFGARRGLLADVLSQVDLNVPISTAIMGIKAACDELGSVSDLQTILVGASEQLRELMPRVGPEPYGIDSTSTTELAVLRQLQLMLEYGGRNLPLLNQSSGLAQLTLFAFSLLSITHKTGSILLIDEPELSLHPQCQRAFLRVLKSLPNQYVVATHSASMLDRADPRHIVRLHRDNGQVKDARPTGLSSVESTRLARFTTPQNAEAFFASAAILVEGESDKYALEALALRKNKNFDADGISIVVMKGAGGIKTFLALLGPNGLRVQLAGLCDAGDEPQWAEALKAHGFAKTLDRPVMASLGFFVCDKDLEDVLITAVGEHETLHVIDGQGESAQFAVFSQQPAHIGKSRHEQLHDFLHSRGRNITYAPLLVDRLDLKNLPASLEGVIDAV